MEAERRVALGALSQAAVNSRMSMGGPASRLLSGLNPAARRTTLGTLK